MSKKMVLLKALLLSTSLRNIYKNCRDKKKRGKIVGGAIGMGILYLMLVAYCIVQAIGFGYFGLTDSIPGMCAMVICLLSFLLTMFKTNGYLFNFKEYDMLMSLPFSPKDIAGCKFLYMYVKGLPWQMSVSFSTMIVYGIYAEAPVYVYPIWIVLSLIMPIIPMLLASFLGFVITKISAGFKHKIVIQTILVFMVVVSGIFLRFFIENTVREEKTEEVVQKVSSITGSVSKIYPPIDWFSNAVKEVNISDILLIIGVSILLFEIVFIPVGRSYRKINSALKSHAASKKKVKISCKRRSVLNTLVFKEFKRMTGSTVYMTNAPIGELLCLVSGIAVLFFDIRELLTDMIKDAPITVETLYLLIPFIIYFFAGMVATTAFTMSLEGKNYWIVQSLPIEKAVLYRSKMLFNMYLTVPVTLFSITTCCISAKVPVISTVLFLILGFTLCAFSTVRGSVCGIKHMRLDWENEIEVIKQGAGTGIYLATNMVFCIIFMGIALALGTVLDQNLAALIMIAVIAGLTGLGYRKVMKLAGK